MAVKVGAQLISPDGKGVAGWSEEKLKVLATAITSGVSAATGGLQSDLRAMIEAAGLGERLPNAIRKKIYPGKDSLRAAGFVYPSGKGAQTILNAFSQGVTIRSSRGNFLAIPTPEAGAGPLGKRITPALWEQKTGIALQFIYRRGGPSLLVANLRVGQGKRGGFRTPSAKASASGKNIATVVIFILMPQVTLTKRLDPKSVAELWAGRVPDLIKRALPGGG
jgi:hypothetical protein